MSNSVIPSANPSAAPEKRVTVATRVPMSVPSLRLSVPEIPGFFLYWHRERDIPKALRAGYTFVQPDEVETNNFDVAGDAAVSGNSDMGSKISVLAGGVSEETRQSQRLYLMKLPNEFREADEKARDAVNEATARMLRTGMAGADQDPEKAMRYLKEGQTMFVPRHARRR